MKFLILITVIVLQDIIKLHNRVFLMRKVVLIQYLLHHRTDLIYFKSKLTTINFLAHFCVLMIEFS